MTRTKDRGAATRDDQCAVCLEPFVDADGRRMVVDRCTTCRTPGRRLCTSCKATLIVMMGRLSMWVNRAKSERREWRWAAAAYLRQRCGCWAARAEPKHEAPQPSVAVRRRPRG